MDVLIDTTLGEVTLPMYPARNGEIVIRKGQPLGQAKPVEILQADISDTHEVHIKRDKSKVSEIEQQPVQGTEVSVRPAVMVKKSN
ncbi:hypothetical protein HPB47_019312 [Ixodes persulcatus]|uniref:Uncharacterized protein n=1 Tax=Ixodes persulcatus TaxID=34615 RepID=A0AC60QII4_IXOPE|nr:hypothetical protein HPB47_019312 [Ixodes persulcatus]